MKKQRYELLPSSFYQNNRKKFAQRMAPNTVAIFFSNDIYPTNADGHLPFRQNNDLLYLSGINQEDTVLVIFPNSSNPAHKEVLFVKETKEEVLKWEGFKYSKEEAKAISGIPTIYYTDSFETIAYQLIVESEGIYLNSNEHFRADIKVQTAEIRKGEEIKKQFPFHAIHRAAPILQDLRYIKHEVEIAAMQKACKLTTDTYHHILRIMKPGMMEYDLEAETVYAGIKNGCRINGYHPIFAGGKSACILHYNDNANPLVDGELVLMDFGHDLGNYNSDLTRCAPVNGKFTQRQKQVYEAVLSIQKQAIAMLKPGVYLAEYTNAVRHIAAEECVKLGLFPAEELKKQEGVTPLLDKYLYHGISHSLGMDVHDVGNRFQAMEAGMVFTVEPGLYIAGEGIGIRIEDDVVIQQNGPVLNLMQGCAKEVAEIEEIMAEGKC